LPPEPTDESEEAEDSVRIRRR